MLLCLITPSDTHTHTFGRTPGQRIGPSQRPLPDTQHSQDTSMSTAGFVSGILSKRAAADPRLSQRGRQNSHRRSGGTNTGGDKEVEIQMGLCYVVRIFPILLSALFSDVTQRTAAIPYRRFGKTCRSHLRGYLLATLRYVISQKSAEVKKE